ncbi:MAG: hypothetical protein KGL39_51050 [Patescibacteria group bacterium]|nr:hypothetical protein [Patescibacteria group bacterium]
MNNPRYSPSAIGLQRPRRRYPLVPSPKHRAIALQIIGAFIVWGLVFGVWVWAHP